MHTLTHTHTLSDSQVAGEAGMNIVGCCLVGGISALGGGAVNAVLYGYAKNGVPWVKTPRNLMIALISSLATFFLWPIMCESMAQERLRRIQDMAKSRSWWDTAWYRATNPLSLTASSSEGITRAEFVAACEASVANQDDSFYKTICRALVPKLKDQSKAMPPTPSQLFDLIDLNGDGVLDVHELQRLVLLEYNGSTARYDNVLGRYKATYIRSVLIW